ncbi:hypothetical protein DFS34DRAFT_629850 [Phlyctochytrium arcticum]|nr:hypothetical protein DFS34DRAFT_629850 [Phlyctochytrium arcticum]
MDPPPPIPEPLHHHHPQQQQVTYQHSYQYLHNEGDASSSAASILNRCFTTLMSLATTLARISIAFAAACFLLLVLNPHPPSWTPSSTYSANRGGSIIPSLRSSSLTGYGMRDLTQIQPAGTLSTILAVPALFGPSIPGTSQVEIHMRPGLNGCADFHLEDPRHQPTPASIPRKHGPLRFILLPRGSCSFDSKIMNAQRAGYDGVCVHHVTHSHTEFDFPIRMAAMNDAGEHVTIPGLFITQADKNVLQSAGRVISPGLHVVDAVVEPFRLERELDHSDVDHHSWIDPDDDDESPWSAAFLSATCLFLGGASALAFGMALILIHRRIFGTAHPSSATRNSHSRRQSQEMKRCITIAADGEMMIDKKIIPMRIVTMEDLMVVNPSVDVTEKERTALAKSVNNEERDSRECTKQVTTLSAREPVLPLVSFGKLATDCCAICIDEFRVGSGVRELPCKHTFHIGCIDPWILNHSLLCPICKRDIVRTSSRPSHRHSNSAVFIYVNESVTMPFASQSPSSFPTPPPPPTLQNMSSSSTSSSAQTLVAPPSSSSASSFIPQPSIYQSYIAFVSGVFSFGAADESAPETSYNPFVSDLLEGGA